MLLPATLQSCLAKQGLLKLTELKSQEEIIAKEYDSNPVEYEATRFEGLPPNRYKVFDLLWGLPYYWNIETDLVSLLNPHDPSSDITKVDKKLKGNLEPKEKMNCSHEKPHQCYERPEQSYDKSLELGTYELDHRYKKQEREEAKEMGHHRREELVPYPKNKKASHEDEELDFMDPSTFLDEPHGT